MLSLKKSLKTIIHYSITQKHKEFAELDQLPSMLTPLAVREPLAQVNKHKRVTKHKASPCFLISIEFKVLKNRHPDVR